MINRKEKNWCFQIMELKDWLNSINYNKDDLSEDIKSYPPYIINRCLSGHMDCIMFANEMNMYSHLDKDMQYYFYLNSLRKRKRFSPWIKKKRSKTLIPSNNIMDIVMKRLNKHCVYYQKVNSTTLSQSLTLEELNDGI